MEGGTASDSDQAEKSGGRTYKEHRAALWEQRLADLRRFKEENGHVNVPFAYQANLQLGRWVSTQRKAYRRTQARGLPTDGITAERVEALNALGFEWDAKKQVTFEERLNQLREFRRLHGHARVPRSDPSLGLFLHNQRKEWRKKQEGKPSRMTDDRADALEKIGVVWEVNHTAPWKERLEELRQYRDVHGDANVPKCYPSNQALGSWVIQQRTEWRKMKEGKATNMTAERVVMLEQLGFVWKLRGSGHEKQGTHPWRRRRPQSDSRS